MRSLAQHQREQEKWRARKPVAVSPTGDIYDDVQVIESGRIPGWLLFKPSVKWFRCVACPLCAMHVRRDRVKYHLERHDEWNDRRQATIDGLGNRHKTLSGQQKLFE